MLVFKFSNLRLKIVTSVCVIPFLYFKHFCSDLRTTVYTFLQPIFDRRRRQYVYRRSVCCPSVRPSVSLTPISRNAIISEWNLPSIYITWVGNAEKVVKVRSQKSRSRPDELTCNGGVYISTVVGASRLTGSYILMAPVPKKGWVHLCNECQENDVTTGVCLCVC